MSAYLSPAFCEKMEACVEAWEVEQRDPDLKNWSVLRESVKEELKNAA